MRQAWEQFFTSWERHAAAPDGALAAPDAAHRRGAEAIAEAARETIRHLRYEQGWSWLNAHLMTGRLVDTATEWLLGGGGCADTLRRRLGEASALEGEVQREEAEWRRTTEAVLAGAAERTGLAAAAG